MQPNSETSSEFPSVIADDDVAPSAYQAALFYLRQGLQAMADLKPANAPEKLKAHAELVRLQREILLLLHVHFAPEQQANTRPFHETFQQHREASGLSQDQVAAYSGLSPSLVRKLEKGDVQPTRKSLSCLCSVAELKLVPAELLTVPAIKESSHLLAPNWYVSPGFDSVTMMADLAQQMNGSGQNIAQTYVYLDHKSALDWIQLANTPSYVANIRESFPYNDVVKKMREVVGQAGLDLIALGPGDGKTEVRLVQHIYGAYERPNIRFYLLDASQPLLSRAFKHAVDTFNDDPGIFVCGIQGNFHHLPRYTQLHYTPARSHRRRMYVLFGNTIGNIDHEPQFFQSAFSGAAPGDLLLFDADYAFTTSNDPDEIQRKDPALSSPVPEGHQRWLGGPIQRYCKDVQDVSFSFRIDTNRPLAGSYGLQFIATVGLPGKRTKEFCMLQVRRYDPSSLIRCLRSFGWEHLGLFPFNGSATRPRGLLMFQKQLPKLQH